MGTPLRVLAFFLLAVLAIAAAKEVWVLVSGDGKDEVFRRVLAGDASIPLGHVLNERSETLIFSDLNIR